MEKLQEVEKQHLTAPAIIAHPSAQTIATAATQVTDPAITVYMVQVSNLTI